MDDWTLWELFTAWGMTRVLRRERRQDLALAVKVGTADEKGWKQGFKLLEQD